MEAFRNQFTELTREVMPAVVQILVDGYIGEDVSSILNPKLGELKSWSGSGFFINTNLGQDIIVTNSHVVKNAKSIRVMSMLTSQESFATEVIGIVKNEEPDVALIRFKKGEFKRFLEMAQSEIPHLSLRDGNHIRRGTKLKAIGYPMGMTEPNITGGEITNFMSGDRKFAQRYVTDAVINPGNSGGPAIDEDGKVIGINTSLMKDSGNVGFITPFMFIEIILCNIIKENAICFSDLGGQFQKNSLDVSRFFEMNETNGIIVKRVERNGFLEKIRVKEEDVVLALNERPIDRHGIFIGDEYHHRENIFDSFKLIPIGEQVKLTVFRDGKKIQIKGPAMSSPLKRISSRPIINEREFIEIWGMTIQILSFDIFEGLSIVSEHMFYQLLQEYDEFKERLVVTDVKKESPAYLQNWMMGESLKTVNGVYIEGIMHLIEILQDSSQTYKLKADSGVIGVFKRIDLKQKVKLKNPAQFLK